jgi:hypothetical protein
MQARVIAGSDGYKATVMCSFGKPGSIGESHGEKACRYLSRIYDVLIGGSHGHSIGSLDTSSVSLR